MNGDKSAFLIKQYLDIEKGPSPPPPSGLAPCSEQGSVSVGARLYPPLLGSGMFLVCFWCVFRGVSGLFSEVFLACFWSVSRMFLGCFCSVSGVFVGCLRGVSGVFPVCYWRVSGLFPGGGPGCFWGIPHAHSSPTPPSLVLDEARLPPHTPPNVALVLSARRVRETGSRLKKLPAPPPSPCSSISK